MPPKKDGVATNVAKEPQKKPRKKNTSSNKKKQGDSCSNCCPSRVRKTKRVVLNSQARSIIAKVYDFMKSEATNNFTLKFKNASWRTAIAVGVSEKTVFRILRERKKIENGSAEAFASKKLDAAKDAGAAVGDLIRGNITGVAENLAGVAGNCIAADAAALGVAASGIASTALNVTGDLVAGKAVAIGDVGVGIGALSSGNLTSAASDFGRAAGALLAGGEAALENLFVG